MEWPIFGRKFVSSGVDLTNILQADFACADPKITKRQTSFQCCFALLGSLHLKALCKMAMKSTPARREEM